jgi:hypothetical protein
MIEYLNLIAFIAFVVFNLLANIIPYGGVTTAYVSDFYANLIAPSGLTFAIWGAIYILVGLFAVYQTRGYKPELTAGIGYWFVLSCIFNIAWLFLWQYFEIPLTLIIMVLLFVCLLIIYLRQGAYTGFTKENTIERVPFSVYLGWISVATIANVTALLVYLNPALVDRSVSPPVVNISVYELGIPQDVWAILIILVATMLCLLVLFTRRDIAYSLVFEWAFLGIVIKRLSDYVSVATAAALGMVVILIGMIIVWYRYWRHSPSSGKGKSK